MKARTCHTVSAINGNRTYYIPSCCVALEILALALEQASSNLLTGKMVLAWVMNMFRCPDRDLGIHELGIPLNKADPLAIFGHSDRTGPEIVDCIVAGICFPLEDTGIGVV